MLLLEVRTIAVNRLVRVLVGETDMKRHFSNECCDRVQGDRKPETAWSSVQGLPWLKEENLLLKLEGWSLSDEEVK